MMIKAHMARAGSWVWVAYHSMRVWYFQLCLMQICDSRSVVRVVSLLLSALLEALHDFMIHVDLGRLAVGNSHARVIAMS